jgi:hypothetical protein
MVTGLGVVRWAARSPAFWKLLASLAPPLRFPGGRILVPGKWRPIGPGQAPCGSRGASRPGMSPRCPDPRATSVPHF